MARQTNGIQERANFRLALSIYQITASVSLFLGLFWLVRAFRMPQVGTLSLDQHYLILDQMPVLW